MTKAIRALWIGAPFDGEVIEVDEGVSQIRKGGALATMRIAVPAAWDPDRRAGVAFSVYEPTPDSVRPMLERCRSADCIHPSWEGHAQKPA
jgi:hypothetical protein